MSEWPFQIRGVRTAGCVENARAGGQRCWAAARIARIRLWFHFFGSPLRLIQWPRENSWELGQTWYRTSTSCTKFECDAYLFRGARGNWGGRIRRSGHGMPCPYEPSVRFTAGQAGGAPHRLFLFANLLERTSRGACQRQGCGTTESGKSERAGETPAYRQAGWRYERRRLRVNCSRGAGAIYHGRKWRGPSLRSTWVTAIEMTATRPSIARPK